MSLLGVSHNASEYVSMWPLNNHTAIVGIDLEGTDRAAEQLWGWLPAADDLPKLRKISDLYWAYWFALHYGSNISMGKLDKYVVYGVANAQTAQLISRAVKSRGRTQLESWPGQYFSIDTPHALALIGKVPQSGFAIRADHV